MHPVLFNQFPVCKDHALLLLFAFEGLPQTLSDELLQLLFLIYKMTTKASLRVGYNSMGADCVVNNLHFHLVDNEAIFGNAEAVFPIEEAEKGLFFTTTLQHKNS
jgi:hypothetical protein